MSSTGSTLALVLLAVVVLVTECVVCGWVVVSAIRTCRNNAQKWRSDG